MSNTFNAAWIGALMNFCNATHGRNVSKKGICFRILGQWRILLEKEYWIKRNSQYFCADCEEKAILDVIVKGMLRIYIRLDGLGFVSGVGRHNLGFYVASEMTAKSLFLELCCNVVKLGNFSGTGLLLRKELRV